MKRSPTSACSSSSSSVGFEKGSKHPRSSNVKSRNCRVNTSSSSTSCGGRRSSIYRGVTRHRWTGRFEAHLWDKNSWNNIQSKKGRQVYLGAYDTEEAAARSYDLAALKYWGPDNTILNFPIETYVKELEEMEKVTQTEYLASLRRQSSGFSRGVSKYRGVARHHHNGRWEARIGRVNGNKYLYLGTYKTQEEAAAAYDMAAIEYRGLNAVTNFDISNYIDKIKKKNDQSQETQTQTETAPISSTESEEAEVLQESTPSPQPQGNNVQKEEQQTQVQHTQVAIMDPVLEQDLPWSFLDTEFSDFQVPDIGFGEDGDMHDIFHGEGLEDDINLLCRPDPDESDFNLNTVFDGPCCGDMVGAAESMADKQRLLSSESSSPSSSTSWVSCNYNL